jgi:hypothetical protein
VSTLAWVGSDSYLLKERGSMPTYLQKPAVKKKTRLSPEQRAIRIQRIFFSALAVIMVLSMIIALVAK